MKKASNPTGPACIGFDLGDQSSQYCLVNANGEVEVTGIVPNDREALTELLRNLPAARVVLEASTQSHWISGLMRSVGREVYVANPRRIPLLTQSSRKNDRNDAELLARIGRLDVELLSPVRERSDACMQLRAQLRARTLLVRMRVRVVNSIRSTLKVFGYKPVSCAVEQVAVRMPSVVPPELKAALAPLFTVLESLNGQILLFDQQLANAGEHRFRDAGALRQVHGVGPLLSLAFVTAIDDPRRFKDSRQVGAYFGLTPKTHQSGQRDPRLRISKEGDPTVRTLLVTAATHVLRRSAPDSDLKRYGKRIAASGTPRDKGRARIAVARKLAMLLHRLWLTGEVYEPLRNAKLAQACA
jgi:transposase